MVTEAELRADYAKMVADPWRWLNAAQNLYSTAELMEPRIHSMWNSVHESLSRNRSADNVVEIAEYQNIYMMLMAFCIENLLKSSIVGRDRDATHRETLKTGRLPKEVKSHDLIDLANTAGLPLSDLEQKLMRRLTKHAKWIGRYPFSTSIPNHYDLTPTTPTIDTGWSLKQSKAVKQLAESVATRLGQNIHRNVAAR